jgi:hypothetical protein
MKRYVFFGLLVFATVASLKLYFYPPVLVKNIRSNTRFSQVIGDKVSPQTLPRVQKYVESAQGNEAEPKICRESREKLLTKKIDEIIADISDRRSNLDANCLTHDENVTSKDLAAAIYSSCQREELIAGRKKQECWQALVFFKAALVTKSFGSRSIEDADAETLVYLFMAKITQGEIRTPTEISALYDITDRLIELMPDSPSALKAAAIPRLVSDFENMTKGEALNPTVDAYVDEALRLNPNDPELQEVSVLRKLYEPGEKISVNKAEMLVQEKPASSLAQYFLAGALENSGRRKDAISAARRAADMEPENNRYQETLRKLQKGEKNAFMVQLGVNFDNL